MLVDQIVPNGRWKARPPAKGLPPGTEWQAAQSAAFTRYSPRAISSGVGVTSAALISGSRSYKRQAAIFARRRTTSGPRDQVAGQRQTPHPLARRGEHGVGERREGRRSAGLAEPARLLRTVDDVNLYRRRLVH